MLIDDTVHYLIESIPSRLHDRTTPGDLPKVSRDRLDNVADSARYGIYSFINASAPPQDIIDYEQLRYLALSGNLTSVGIRYRLMTETPEDYRSATIGSCRAAVMSIP
jgi:hypothetical protein